MNRQSRVKAILTVAAALVILALQNTPADAAVVTTGLSVHYRADDVDNLGNPGNGATTTLVNLANPGTHNGTIVNGAGILQNVAQIGTPYEYGVVLDDSIETHVAANTFQIAGGTNKVTSATWEYWLRADSGVTANRGALYGEFAAGATNQTRHYLRLEGIGAGTRTALYDEYPPSGNSAASDSQLFDTSTFTQIVVTKSGNAMTFYKDGAQVGAAKNHSETFSGSVAQTAFGFRNAQNESFDGQFNIIRVYDTVLTSAEALGNYNAELGITPPPPPPGPIKIDPAELSATANTNSATATAAVDGSGLDDVYNPSTHQDAGGFQAGHWRSGDYNHGGGVEANEWFVIDLGGVRDLAEMRVWSGFQDRGQTRSPTRRNLERFDLYYANTAGDPGNPLDNPGNWTFKLGDQAVPDPENNNVGVGGDNNDLISILDAGVYNLTGTTATHLALFDLQNGGIDGWTGHHTSIAEIELFVVPEPSTFILAALGLLGLIGFGRRRRR